MNHTFIYGLVIYVLLVPVLQISISISYFWKFAKEYLYNERSSWDPSNDRALLFFSVGFTLISVIIAKQIFSGETENSILRTLLNVFSLTVFLLFTVVIFYLRYKNLQQFKEAKYSLTLPESKVDITETRSYGNLISAESKIRLFKDFKKYSLVDDDLKQEDFVSQFLVDTISLKMDVPAFREFYNLLLKKYPQLGKIKPKDFVSLFINSKKGDLYDLKQFGKNAFPISKISEELNSIFENLDKEK